MNQCGPELESLTRRLAETPDDFLVEPSMGTLGSLCVAALANDVRMQLGIEPGWDLSRCEGVGSRAERNRLSLVAVMCWLLSDAWFLGEDLAGPAVWSLLDEEVRELAHHVEARAFVTEADRREELVRVALAHLGFRPAGETREQAEDRLTTLSSSERVRLRHASRQAEARARQIREALARKAAEEAADKYNRE